MTRFFFILKSERETFTSSREKCYCAAQSHRVLSSTYVTCRKFVIQNRKYFISSELKRIETLSYESLRLSLTTNLYCASSKQRKHSRSSKFIVHDDNRRRSIRIQRASTRTLDAIRIRTLLICPRIVYERKRERRRRWKSQAKKRLSLPTYACSALKVTHAELFTSVWFPRRHVIYE